MSTIDDPRRVPVESGPATAHAMTPSLDHTLRVRIAEAQGWKLRRFSCVGTNYCALINPAGKQVGDVYDNESDILGMWLHHTPNWPEDLNACVQFEAGLTTEEQRWKYISELIDITKAESMEVHSEVFVVATATARQRCEAYLHLNHNENPNNPQGCCRNV